MQIIAVLGKYNSIWNLVRHKTLYRTVWKLWKIQILQSLLYWNLTSRLFPYQPPRKSRARLCRRYKEVMVLTGRLVKEKKYITPLHSSPSQCNLFMAILVQWPSDIKLAGNLTAKRCLRHGKKTGVERIAWVIHILARLMWSFTTEAPNKLQLSLSSL